MIVHDSAKEEVWKALEMYDLIQPELASSFRRELASAFARIQTNPRLFAEEEGGERYCMLSRFPYTVVYVELDEAIWVSAVAHQKRRPRYWKHRKTEGE